MKTQKLHKFHIPVMGLAYTIDTPVKVAKYGIDSTVSIIEDHLIEGMREVICKREILFYEKIEDNVYDYRAKRITAYLNVLADVVSQQVENIRQQDIEKDYDINQYFKLLPTSSKIRKIYETLPLYNAEDRKIVCEKLKRSIKAGSIDVNIMTKLDKPNSDKEGHELPPEFSDALSALRGYANSKLESSIIFSAGLNPRLFSYCENFPDFFPDSEGNIKKKIVLKVSDYRSAMIQGKFLAKKGLLVSEFRVESGINCGGHAFVTDGMLFGPILEEFKLKRNELFDEIINECMLALERKGKFKLKSPKISITAQGGIGTAEENEFLMKYYNLDSIGWGSPFLLVPEVTNVDEATLLKLSKANKENYYLSDASPLGIPFNNFNLSSSEEQRKQRIAKNRPGSPCYKKFLSSNKEFTDTLICTASRQYQELKIKELRQTVKDEKILKKQIDLVTEKDCLCEGLGASALLVNNAKLSHGLKAVAICPGPNLAYFKGIFSLSQMVDHIYGRANILSEIPRPNVFLNELELYITYFKKEFEKYALGISMKNESYFVALKKNLVEGIKYYETLSGNMKNTDSLFSKTNKSILRNIKSAVNKLTLAQNDFNELTLG